MARANVCEWSPKTFQYAYWRESTCSQAVSGNYLEIFQWVPMQRMWINER